MSSDVLKIIASAMEEIGLNYEFMEWTSEPVYPYFVGEYQESESETEDGLQECTFILNGFSRTTWASLENAKTLIEKYFNKISGHKVISQNGSGVAIFYSSSQVILLDDAELKRIQINLSVMEWSVN